MAEAARGRKGIWLLAKGGKTRSHLRLTPTLTPNLVTSIGTTTTLSEEADALKACLFPPMPDADPPNIPNASYNLELSSPMSILDEENLIVIKKLHPFRAAGSDGIPFFVLKCLGSPLVSFLKPLFQASTYLSYNPTAF